METFIVIILVLIPFLRISYIFPVTSDMEIRLSLAVRRVLNLLHLNLHLCLISISFLEFRVFKNRPFESIYGFFYCCCS